MRRGGKLRRIHGHLLLALLGLLLARPSLTTNIIGSGLGLAGIALRVWAAGVLEKGKGLCTDGPYRYVRHPLYLGSLLAAIGFTIMMNVVWGWAVVLPLFFALYAAQVHAEEGHLRATFGAAHAEFASEVPLLLPWFSRVAQRNGRPWSLSQALVNREQYHVGTTLLLIAFFFLKGYLGQ